MAQWSHTDLSQAATAPAGASQLFGDLSRPMGCVRFDRTNVVLFTGNDGHIHQLHLSGATWVHSDLSHWGEHRTQNRAPPLWSAYDRMACSLLLTQPKISTSTLCRSKTVR